MTANNLLSELNRQGIRLEADGGRLWCYPPEALTPDLLARLKAHKAELLAILNANQQAEAAKHGDQPQADQAGQAQREDDVALAEADSPAAADQPGLVETARRCLAQRLEALERAGVQQLGRARPDAAADVPPGPADVATETADGRAATTPEAPAAIPEAGQAEAPAATPEAGQADGQATGQTDAQAAIPAAGQADGQADAQAASGGELDPRRLWLRAVEELAGELPPDVLDGLRDATARWGGAKPPGPRSYDLRCRCGSAAWNLTVLLRPPHYGYAVRAVCGRCRKVLGLLWWEGGPGPLADDPPHPGELAAGS